MMKNKTAWMLWTAIVLGCFAAALFGGTKEGTWLFKGLFALVACGGICAMIALWNEDPPKTIEEGVQNGITLFGMELLFAGLILAALYDTARIDIPAMLGVQPYGFMPPTWVVINILWTAGGAVLIIPPAMAGLESFVVLQGFLTISGMMSFWEPEEFWQKATIRLGNVIKIRILELWK